MLGLCAAPSAAQANCQAAVQGQIPWSKKGGASAKKWAQNNLNRLCGDMRSDEPARCFNRVLNGITPQGSTLLSTWQEAIDLCERTSNASKTISCYGSKIFLRYSRAAAIANCDDRAQAPTPVVPKADNVVGFGTPAVISNNIKRQADSGMSFYLRSSDVNLFLHAHGGTKNGAQETLHPCPKGNNHPNCQWVLEASGTRRGAYYIRSLGGALYLHAHGGTKNGANLTLHPCPKGNNYPNCQWFIEASKTRDGAFYLRSADGAMYAHSHGGSKSGARNTLHACPKLSNHPNCQWYFDR